MPVLHHGEAEAENRVLRGLRLAVGLSLLILILESVGAYLSQSLSLTVDAIHNVPDILAFAISWMALQGTRVRSSQDFTFGTHRLEVFAGLFNGALVLGAGVIFGYEAVASLLSHPFFAGEVNAVWLLAVAIPTLVLRIANMSVLGEMPGRVRDLNLKSVIVHLASDLAITGALLFAGAVLFLSPDFGWADPLAALAIAGILVFESLPLLKEGWEVLTERVPRGLSAEAITRSAMTVSGVREIHDLHVWAVCSTLVCLTAHVEVGEMSLHESRGVVERLRERMEKDFGILHATFEVECPCPS